MDDQGTNSFTRNVLKMKRSEIGTWRPNYCISRMSLYYEMSKVERKRMGRVTFRVVEPLLLVCGCQMFTPLVLNLLDVPNRLQSTFHLPSRP